MIRSLFADIPTDKEMIYGRPALSPEEELVLAVIFDAIFNAQKNDLDWVKSDEGVNGRGWLFSFRSCCDILNIDAEWLRGIVLPVMRRVIHRRDTKVRTMMVGPMAVERGEPR